jgi:hypothetical protein
MLETIHVLMKCAQIKIKLFPITLKSLKKIKDKYILTAQI